MNDGRNNQMLEEEKLLKEVKKTFGEQYEKILLTNRDENAFIEKLKEFIRENAKQISTSQLRNIYTKIKKLKDNSLKEVYTLRPKLAYVYGRSDSIGMKKLLVLLDDKIKAIKTKNELEQFKSFFEAIIAYHKFYGGKN
jgi:CRISPR-associated protein Csm2